MLRELRPITDILMEQGCTVGEMKTWADHYRDLTETMTELLIEQAEAIERADKRIAELEGALVCSRCGARGGVLKCKDPYRPHAEWLWEHLQPCLGLEVKE